MRSLVCIGSIVLFGLAACVSATGPSDDEDIERSGRADVSGADAVVSDVVAVDALVSDVPIVTDVTDSGAADGSGAAADTTADTGGPSAGEFGWPCEEDADCNSNFCVPDEGALICTELCAEDTCPEGWTCRFFVNAGGDGVRVCLPNEDTLCVGCDSSLDCGGQANACVRRAGQTFCGTGCERSSDCPEAYACETVTDVEGRSARQCIPASGSCTCPPEAVGDSRACVRVSEWGVCEGVEVCQSGAGWSDCTAFTPTEEICDGVDNDCDGSVDEDLVPRPCDGPLNAVGQCTGTETCEGAAGWSCDAPTAAIEICDGLDNDCNGIPDDGLCFDGNPCTTDICDPEGGCSYRPRAGECDDGNLCTTGDRCTEGACVGGPVDCNDGNVCTNDRCDPFEGCVRDPLSGGACETGNLCTNDVCRDGACTSGGNVNCGTPDQCLAPTCDPATGCSTERLSGIRCDDDDRCTVTDECANGSCIGVDYCLGQPCTNEECSGEEYSLAIGLGCIAIIPFLPPQCPCLCL
jgi:hypothetical protein